MRKILILPYFGKFNDYFNLWIESCKYNSDIDWLIITDNNIKFDLPKNIKVVNQTFDQLKLFFQSKFDFKINLKNPYKLCDYKSYYGYIFEDYIKDYDFWGYCDCDLIFGEINKFLDDSLFEKYDKLLRTGHLSFIRNTKEINTNFMKYDTYKMVLKSSAIYGYDESIDGYHKGFAGELIDSGYKFFDNSEYIADIDFRHHPFRIINNSQYTNIFTFEEGKTYRIYSENNKIKKEEVMYIHFQKRNMINNVSEIYNKYLVYPNKFDKYDDILVNDLYFHQIHGIEIENYFNHKKEKIQSLKRDFIRFIYEPKKVDSIKYRLKLNV